ncbi:MAG TPA: MFS transporter [Candidatus Didemnitutus sp.]|nr:MFS transporter [Candidatus Didemnitutus sp.]
MPLESSASGPTRAWSWVPTLYYGQGLPYVVVMTVSTVLYKNLGVSNTDIALFTSWLYLPWVIKPLWSPVIEFLGRKRAWVITLQFAMAGGFALIALAIPGGTFFRTTLALFWVVALSSATHDIAADGFYLLALPPASQAAFVGVRSTFYRLAMLSGQGGLVWLAGRLDSHGLAPAWVQVFWLLAAGYGVLAFFNLVMMPHPPADNAAVRQGNFGRDYLTAFVAFFQRPTLVRMLAFLLVYRFAEAQLLKLVNPFLLDRREAGGLGLTDQQVGILYGEFGVAALILGGILGGVAIARGGLRKWLWPMATAMSLPNLVFVYLALAQPSNEMVIGASLVVEQFGYGFGFAAYLVYLMQMAEGPYRTAHYAIGTGFMALGMMIPGLWAGWLQERIGYTHFFGWVLIAAVPSLAVTFWVRRGLPDSRRAESAAR